MTDFHMARAGEPMCFICGRVPNPWCTEYHLPNARTRVEQMRADANRAESEIAAYEAAAKNAEFVSAVMDAIPAVAEMEMRRTPVDPALQEKWNEALARLGKKIK